MTYKDLELPAQINEDPYKKLTASEVEEDRKQLLHALNTAYSGHRYLPNDEFPTLVKELNNISGPIEAKEFCGLVGSYFANVSDNHLSAKFSGSRCFEKASRKPQVGKNYFRSKTKFWDVRIKKFGKVPALLISITEFPNKNDRRWKGFIQSVAAKVKSAKFIVLDMRDNSGGDDSKGYDLATLLAGAPPKTAYAEQKWTNKPESMQLFINYFRLDKVYDAKAGKPIDHLDALIAKFTEKRQMAIEGKLPASSPFAGDSNGKDPSKEFAFDHSVQKPIYILMNAGCASSCESTIDFFELNPLAKRVGEPTGGYVHFGNNGIVVLKNSGVKVQMAISFNTYRDGRFIEKKGIAPTILVTPGNDAMTVAVSDYLKSVKK